MVSTTTILSLTIAVIVLLVFCLLPVFFLRRKGYRIGYIVFYGALGFIISQQVIRLSLLSVLGSIPSFLNFLSSSVIYYVLFMAGSSALLETLGRFFVFKTLMRKKQGWMEGTAAGFGHGICEAIILLGFTYINYIIFSLMINQGSLASSGLLTPEGVTNMSMLLTNFPLSMIPLAIIERILIILAQTALSVYMMIELMNSKTMSAFIVPFVIQLVFNGLLMFVQINMTSMLINEILIVTYGILGATYLFTSYQKHYNK